MGFMFCDLHVSLKQPSVGGYKFVAFALLDLDQASCYIGPDMSPNCLQRLLADDKCRQRVNIVTDSIMAEREKGL